MIVSSVCVVFCTEKSGPFGGSKKKAVKITTNDRVSVFIELADAHRQLSQTVKLSAGF